MHTDEQNQAVNPFKADSWLVHQQLVEASSNARTSNLGNLINAAITLVLMSPRVPIGLLVVGALLMAAMLVWRGLIAARLAEIVPTDADLANFGRQFEINASALGAVWGIGVGLLMWYATPTEQTFLGIVGAGMMGAGTLGYRTHPSASKAYVLAGLPGYVGGLTALGGVVGMAAIGLLCSYVFVLLAIVATISKNFEKRIEHERELVRSKDTIGLLLNEFAEQGSDWLFELDEGGGVVNPSVRFAEASRRPIETLTAKNFLDIFEPGREASLLAQHFAADRLFRRQIVPLTVGGLQYWWSVSARKVEAPDTGWRGVITDITAQRQAEQQVNYLAHFDGMTNLSNRFRFNDKLYRALTRDEGHAGIMYLDLDNFKSINDTLGHAMGDRLLQEAARRLEKCAPNAEIIARLGGDEFAILFAKPTMDRMDDVAAAIIEELSRPIQLGDHQVVIGTSIGIACGPGQGRDTETLVRNADLALYAAKSGGRNRWMRFETGMDEAAQQRRLIEMDLRGALAKDEMCLHYQPLIAADTGETTGYEALIRWEHPGRGTVMPNDFIPIAEETGLIVQIGEWVIRQAIDDLATWPTHISVSVNLSPAQMRSPSLIQTLVNALARTGVDAGRVCFEITETVLMQDSDANVETLHKLRGIGVQIALDDFGTGYSSLNYLRSFPFSKIKIDRCFVADIDKNADCLAIIRSVVSLANSLGMTTTAEGVEREEQMALLCAEGCSEVQGYLFSKAVAAEELTDLRNPKPRPEQRLVYMEEMRRKLEAAPAQSQAA
jgi:diguanylate cyclase (GGDEF)-like protein